MSPAATSGCDVEGYATPFSVTRGRTGYAPPSGGADAAMHTSRRANSSFVDSAGAGPTPVVVDQPFEEGFEDEESPCQRPRNCREHAF
jgi:hypothetical protein